MKKLWILILLAAALTVGAQAAYSDVPEEHWASDAIAEMSELGIVNGFPDGTFRPNDTLTRAQFLAMVVRTAAQEETDAPSDGSAWWAGYRQAADEYDLLKDLYWEPVSKQMDAAIPRQEAASVLVQANTNCNGLSLTTAPDESKFADDETTLEGFRNTARYAAAQGLVEGYPDGTFGGTKSLTRAEGCTLIQRLLSQKALLAEGGSQAWNNGEFLIRHCIYLDGSATLTSLRISDGTVVDTLEVPADGREMEPWEPVRGREVSGAEGNCFWGFIGYYTVSADGHLEQWTDRAVLDWQADPLGDGIVAISVEPGTRVYYSGGGIYNVAGNEVLRIRKDGTVETLLSNKLNHGLNLVAVNVDADGSVRVDHQFVMGMMDVHTYEYAVENGKLRALVHEPGAGYAGYTEEEAAQIQAQMDAGGYGVGSKT